MKYIISIFIIFFAFNATLGQNKKSKGDNYFFAYSYKKAIKAYEEDMEKGIVLSPQQYLNLADSYFQTQNYEKATSMYLQYFSNDTVTDNFRLNKLLQGLSKSTRKQELQEILTTKGLNLDKEILENLELNMEMLSSDQTIDELEYKIFNLNGNSVQSDFSPSFYNENLLFTSDRPLGKKTSYEPTGEAYLDIFNGDIGADGQLINNPIPLGILNSSNYHKATPYFSEKLEGFFYVLSNTQDGELEFDDNGKNALAIGYQKLNGDFRFLWRDLSTSFYYPFYHGDTDRLYFAANLEGGYGGTDIYYVNTNRGNIMSAPINLGPRVNSPGNEIAPYVFENSLYFSSDIKKNNSRLNKEMQ